MKCDPSKLTPREYALMGGTLRCIEASRLRPSMFKGAGDPLLYAYKCQAKWAFDVARAVAEKEGHYFVGMALKNGFLAEARDTKALSAESYSNMVVWKIRINHQNRDDKKITSLKLDPATVVVSTSAHYRIQGL